MQHLEFTSVFFIPTGLPESLSVYFTGKQMTLCLQFRQKAAEKMFFHLSLSCVLASSCPNAAFSLFAVQLLSSSLLILSLLLMPAICFFSFTFFYFFFKLFYPILLFLSDFIFILTSFSLLHHPPLFPRPPLSAVHFTLSPPCKPSHCN